MATIVKLSDEVFGGNHPNDINTGYTQKTTNKIAFPTPGERYCFGTLKTSTVDKVISFDDMGFTFKTSNSTYQVKY